MIPNWCLNESFFYGKEREGKVSLSQKGLITLGGS